jgi:hypothetical protein
MSCSNSIGTKMGSNVVEITAAMISEEQIAGLAGNDRQ